MMIQNKIKNITTNSSNPLDLVGLYMLFLILILNPFHFILFDKFIYYRELFSFIFLVLGFVKLLSSEGYEDLLQKTLSLHSELFYIILFSFLLIFFALIDTGRCLYDLPISGASLHLNNMNPSLYVLRNAFIYLPMIGYFFLRGLTESEIKKIAFVIVLVSPLSILSYIYHEKMATIGTLNSLVKLYGANFNYNSYVPYLTFAFISALYLIFTDSNKAIKIISFSVIVILSNYILLSLSRQSLLFLILFGTMFILISNEMSYFKKGLILVLYLVCSVAVFQQLTYGIDIQNFDNRYSTIKTNRLQLAKEGLGLLKPIEYITGAGLSSVINSGPHNDFIRWLQRIGIFAMLLGFIPFFIAGWRSFRYMLVMKRNSLFVYLWLSIGFTLYHSMFGYPREDAYQALYCFLSLTLYLGLGYNKHPLEVLLFKKTTKLMPDFVGILRKKYSHGVTLKAMYKKIQQNR